VEFRCAPARPRTALARGRTRRRRYLARRMVRGMAARVGARLYPDRRRTRDRLRFAFVVAYRAAQGRSVAPPTARQNPALDQGESSATLARLAGCERRDLGRGDAGRHRMVDVAAL